MGVLSVNMHRSFSCGLLQSTTASLHTFASPLRVSTSQCVSIFREEHEVAQLFEENGADDLFHITSSVLQSSIGEDSCGDRHWKVLRPEEHGIVDKWIPQYTWKVLRRLRERGHETYLVGGSVRDMLLKQVPKDFDVLTTAGLNQVKKGFPRAMIVGRRFPICHVRVQNKIIEVSSFNKVLDMPFWYTKEVTNSSGPNCDDVARWKNSMRRDFTINGFFYDPFKKTVYDYLGGIDDLNKKKIRTVVPAERSFAEDSARILRAVRLAARLGFKLSRETALAIRSRSESIKELNQERLRMEVNYFMSYGAAEASFRLLWRFGLLEMLFPPQAAYFADQGFKRQEKSSNMLLALLANLDRLLTPAKPCHCTLWICLLAIHLALFAHPRSPVVVTALAIAVHGYKIEIAVRKALKVHQKFADLLPSFPEIDLECKLPKSLIKQKVLELAEDIISSLHCMNNAEYLATAMWKHPEAPSSDLVVVTKQHLIRCKELFYQLYADNNDMLRNEISSGEKTKDGNKICINRIALQAGQLSETGFVFRHIVISTLYPGAAKRQKELAGATKAGP